MKKSSQRATLREESRDATLRESCIPGISILELDEASNQSNIAIVKKQVRAHVMRNFKTMGDCIQSMKLEEIKDYVCDEDLDLTTKGDPGGIKAHIMKKEIEENLRERRMRDEELTSLFGLLLSILSPSSQQRVFSSKKYKDAEDL